MAKVNISDAPGCIGSCIIRLENSPVCKNCTFTNICAQLSRRNAKKLRDQLGLKELSDNTGKKLMKGAEKIPIAQLESSAFEGKKPLTFKGDQLRRSMSKTTKTAEIIQILARNSRTDVDHGLQFVEPHWARQALLLLWDNNGVIKKKDLRDFLQHELGISRMVTLVNVSNFINAATNMNLVEETKESMRLNNENQ